MLNNEQHLLTHCEAASGDVVVVADVVDVPARREQSLSLVQLDPTLARVLNNRLIVIAILSVAGPIGLPALWLSRRFSRPTKVITTVLFLLLTIGFPLAMVYYWCEVALRPLVDAFAGAGM